MAAGGGLFGHYALLPRFVRFVRKRIKLQPEESLRILVAHASAVHQAQELKSRVLAAFDGCQIEFCEITDVGTAIGVHGGPGTLIVAVQKVRSANAI